MITPPDSRQSDLLRIGWIKWLVKLPAFQFLLTLPVLALMVLATLSLIFGVKHPAFNFGLVLAWVVWWGLLIFLFSVVGRGWCLVCPFGAVGEWLQRLSFWWKTRIRVGLNLKYPSQLQNLWPGVAFFIGFIFLDAGYGISNNPTLTAGLVIVLTLSSLWAGLFFERRTFCRFLCPISVFIGMSSMMAPFEIRSKSTETCRGCEKKDCFNGNEKSFGCPTFQFQGAGLDSNRDCILCSECIRACPHENVAMRFRQWGHDLWARKKARLDESVAAVVITAIVTVVSVLLVVLLPKVLVLMRPLLPAGTPPNDWPRLVSILIVFLGGITCALLLMYMFSYFSKIFSGHKEIPTRTFFTHFGYSVIPLGVMKFLADILDHVFRTWGSLTDATRALTADFPLNRLMLNNVTVKQLMGAVPTFILQMALIAIGFGISLYVAQNLARKMFPENKNAAFRALLPVGAFIFILSMTALWALAAAV